MDYKEHYKIDAREFDYWGSDQFSPSESRRNQVIYALSEVKPADMVLDIGSGRGWFSLYAADLGADVTALDLSEDNLNKIKKANSTIRTVYGDACDVPLQGEKFDLIVALEVLEHLVDPSLAVSNWLQLLKPGGRLLITVPYREKIRYTLCIHCNRKTPVNAHLHSFDHEGLIKLLNRNGYWVRKTQLFLHKFLVTFRINELLKKLPFRFWSMLDRAGRHLNDKYAYIALLAVPKE